MCVVPSIFPFFMSHSACPRRRRFTHLGRAWSLKEFAAAHAPKNIVERNRRNWLSWAQRFRLKSMEGVRRRHSSQAFERGGGVVAAACEGVTNARAESVNARIQWIKRQANACRCMERFIMAIMFHLGKLDMRLKAHI